MNKVEVRRLSESVGELSRLMAAVTIDGSKVEKFEAALKRVQREARRYLEGRNNA
jgi:hypothetical protein